MSVTGKGLASQRASFLVLISIAAILLSVMALLRPTTALAQDDVNDHPALNIAKENEAGDRLAGAVFMVEGSDEQFTTGENGKVCITELNGQFLEDRPYLVTEVTPPQGYALPSEPSQMVEPDNDGTGHCASPDAVFVDPTASATPTPSPTPTPTSSPTPTPTPTPRESEEGGTPTPSPTPTVTPRESELGGNPTPTPDLPDTAVGQLDQASNAGPIVGLIAMLLAAALTYVRFAVRRAGG